ncbi:hypothetical protein AAMO2058_001319000 [Amorphochlora amoebiformis]
MPRKAVVSFFVFCVTYVCAYLNGSDVSTAYCWTTDVTLPNRPTSRPFICPEGISLTYEEVVEGNINANSLFTIKYSITINSSFQVVSSPEISHANLHACRQIYGDCTPLLGATPGLISQSPASMGFLDANTRLSTFEEDFSLDAGEWSLVAHIQFNTRKNGGGTILWDVAVGRFLTSEIRRAYFSTSTEIFIAVAAGFVFIYYIWLGILTIRYRSKSIMKSHPLWLSLVNVLGAVIFGTTVFVWSLYMTDETCVAMLWILGLGFSLLVSPLLCKSLVYWWFDDRHANLTDALRQRESTLIGTNLAGMIVVGGMVLINTTILIIWTAIRMPKVHDVDPTKEFQNTCESSDTAHVLGGLMVSINAICLFLALIASYRAKREGYHKLGLIRTRRSILYVCIPSCLVVIMETGFPGNAVLNDLARSIGIFAAGIGGTLWLYYTCDDSNALDKVGFNLQGMQTSHSRQSSYGENEGVKSQMSVFYKDGRHLQSMKVFEQLFESRIVRGYITNHAIQSCDSESVEFCSDVIEFKKKCKSSAQQEHLLEEAERLADHYICVDAPKQVNISGEMRCKILKELKILKEQFKAVDIKERTESDELVPKKNSVNISHLFDQSFRESRKLVYLNNWRSFRESENGLAAASWFDWMTFLDGYSREEKIWGLEDLTERLGAELSKKNELQSTRLNPGTKTVDFRQETKGNDGRQCLTSQKAGMREQAHQGQFGPRASFVRMVYQDQKETQGKGSPISQTETRNLQGSLNSQTPPPKRSSLAYVV